MLINLFDPQITIHSHNKLCVCISLSLLLVDACSPPCAHPRVDLVAGSLLLLLLVIVVVVVAGSLL
jgi:hypothetical protein